MSERDFAIIEGEELPLSSPEALEFLIQTVLKSSQKEGLVSELVQFIHQRTKLPLLSRDVLSLLQEWVLLQQNQKTSFSDQAGAVLDRITKHKLEAERTWNSYNKEDKINPNAVFWPNPADGSRSRDIFEEEVFSKSCPILNKTVPIGSAGSCFASEIAYRLQEEGYNYVITEDYKHPDQPGKFPPACAAYGSIFNTLSFTQLIEKAFGERELPRLIVKILLSGKIKYYDPFRDVFLFDSREELEANYEPHREACRKAFEQCKVFCLTVGLNEVWKLKAYDVVIPRYPLQTFSPLLEHKVLTVEDNVNNLQRMLNIWRKFNPDIQLIISVSPIPINATFRANEQHVIASNFHTKATLRVALDEFVKRNDGVYYFPSYETVMYTVRDAWKKDGRHVSKSAVDKVMKLFTRTFVSI